MNTFLTLVLGNETFAVDVAKVLEVLQSRQITAIPKTPKHVLGIINFRGEILPVIDARKKFGIQPSDEQKHIVIVFELDNNNKKSLIAATADTVKDVIQIDDSEIKSVPELGLSYESNYILGAIHRNDDFILLLNIEKVFSEEEIASLNIIQNS